MAGRPVDGQEHDKIADGVAQLAAVYVDVADLVGTDRLRWSVVSSSGSWEMP